MSHGFLIPSISPWIGMASSPISTSRPKVRFASTTNSQHLPPPGRFGAGDLALIADYSHRRGRRGAAAGGSRLYRHPGSPGSASTTGWWRQASSTCSPAAPLQVPARPGRGQPLSETVCEGIPIRLSIERRSVTVTVRDTVYNIGYFTALDRWWFWTGRLAGKFWQEKGLPARREGIGHLLRGGSCSEKAAGCPLQVEGYHFRDFF